MNFGDLKSVGVWQPLAVNITVNEVFVGGGGWGWGWGEEGGTPTETHPTSDIASELP